MTPEQMKQMQLMNSPGFRAAVQARPASNTPSSVPQMQPAPQMQQAPPVQAQQQAPQGLLARMGAGIQNFRSDPERMARLQMGLNSMRLNPDQGIAASAANTIQQSQERRTAGLDANKTVALLRSKGHIQLADMVAANPSMAKEALKALTTRQMGTDFSSKNIGSIQTAQEDILENGVVIVKKGGQYTYNQNPNAVTGEQYTIVPLAGSGLTDAAQNDMILAQQKAEWDMTQGLKKGDEVFSQFNIIDQQIQSFQRAGELVSEGAKTGFIQKFLPSTSAATTELRQIANTMGIDIINSATFGALSATELRLALETGFDQNLSGDALVEYIQNKIAAQTKLRNALMPEVQMLLGGSGLKAYADYKIENSKRHDAAQNAFSQIQQNNPSLTAEEWRGYNLEEREAVMRDGGLL
tara:strand:- start:242 stop:1474 length:1233 start_codon:yes stop_codon:yes gene_type:complete